MKSVTGKDLTRVLENHEWELVRIHGEHCIYGKPDGNARLSVPVHGTAALKIGLLNHLLKSARLTESDL